MNTRLLLVIIFSIFIFSGCSDDEGERKKELTGEHVWKEQTDSMDKARAVEGILEDAAKEQRDIIEENVQ